MSEKPKVKRRETVLPDAEQSLAPQFGTDPQDLAEGRFDIRRLSFINPIEKVWTAYFMQIPDEEGGEYARDFVSNYLNLSMSEGGRRATQIINAIGASKGGSVQTRDERSWTERHLTLRDEAEARQKGKIKEE